MGAERGQTFLFGEESLFAKIINSLPLWLRLDQYEYVERINRFVLTMIERKLNDESEIICTLTIGMLFYYSFWVIVRCFFVKLFRITLHQIMGPIHNNKPTVYALNSIRFITALLFVVSVFSSLSVPILEFHNIPSFYFIFFFVQNYIFSLCRINYKPLTKNETRNGDLTTSEKVLDFFKNIVDFLFVGIIGTLLAIGLSEDIFYSMPLIVPSEDYLHNNSIYMNTSKVVLLYFTFLFILKIFGDDGRKAEDAQKKNIVKPQKIVYHGDRGITSVDGIDIHNTPSYY